MSSKGYAAAVLVAGLMVSSAALADTSTLARSNGWEAFGGTTTNGTLVCGISTAPRGRYFGLKLFDKTNTLTIQISQKDWEITKGNKYGVTMRFDRHRTWRATATGIRFNDGDPGLEYEINRKELGNFNRELATSERLLIQFTNGMDDFSLALSGAHDVEEEFRACIDKMQ